MNAKKNAQDFENPAGQDGEQAAEESWEEPTPEAAAAGNEQALTDSGTGGLEVSEQLMEARAAIESFLMRQTGPRAEAYSPEELAGAGNIVGVGFGRGEGMSGGEPGSPSLNVYVAEPVSPETVRAVLVESLGVSAASDDAAPINVVVTGQIDAQPHRFRLRPTPAGVSVAHTSVTAGTIACLAIGRNAPWNRRLLVLSNNHVLANSNAAKVYDPIVQPGPYDGGRMPGDQIAVLAKWVPIAFDGSANYVDCAVGWAWPDRVRREEAYVSGGAVRLFRVSNVPRPCALGMIVGKSGRTTQITVGRIIDCSASVRVNYGSGRVALFRDQIIIQGLNGAFSAGGDSGSLIWTWDGTRNPVGLLFAGSSTVTIANKIGHVLNALDINLYT